MSCLKTRKNKKINKRGSLPITLCESHSCVQIVYTNASKDIFVRQTH